MKAACSRRYGPPSVVILKDLADPVPKAGEVLVRIEAAGVTVGDARIRAARVPRGMGPLIRIVFGLTGPRRPVLGREYAGRVAALGTGVNQFKVGDAVFGITEGMRLGAHAELAALKADGLIFRRPETLSIPEAATFFFGGLTAADFLLDQCALKAGERVLVVGATGAVGSAAVQLARYRGAHVTALTSATHRDLARELGAHEASDYSDALPKGPFDVILDVPGLLPDARERLAPHGRLGLVTATLGQTLAATLWPRRAGNKRVCAGIVKETPAACARLLALHTAGAYRPLVGDTFSFADIARAHALVDSGHKRGSVLVRMASTDEASTDEASAKAAPK